MLWIVSLALALPVQAVGHQGTVRGSTMQWETHVLLPLKEGQGKLPLAMALPAETELLESPQGRVEAVLNAEGQPVALALSDFPPRTERVVIRMTQPFDEHSLHPPLIDAEAMQRVTLDGAFYEPEGGVGVYKHLRYLAQTDITYLQRLRLDRALDGEKTTLEQQPIYLVVDAQLTQAGGLHGTVAPVGERKGGVALVAGALFLLLLGFCTIGYRALANLAKREGVDAYIRSEFDGTPTTSL